MRQSHVSNYVESVESTARGTDITVEMTSGQTSSSIDTPVEVSSSQASNCVESLGTTTCTIDNPLKETGSHVGQPVVMRETLDLSR